MSTRRRIVGYIVQPIIVDDDGTDLTSVEVKPVEISRSEWPNVVESMAAAEKAMQEAFAAEQNAANPPRAARRAAAKKAPKKPPQTPGRGATS